MAGGALHDVTLGYQLLWNAAREVAGVQLVLEPHGDDTPDVAYLLKTLAALWDTHAVPLILSTNSSTLLAGLLDQTPPALARLAVTDTLLQNPVITPRVHQARQRGLALLWRGEPGAHPRPAYAACFIQTLLSLSTEEALLCLRVCRHRQDGGRPTPGLVSPVRAGQIYEGLASRALAQHGLDEQNAAALLGWPAEDVLHNYGASRIQPGQPVIRQLIRAIHADAGMDEMAQLLGQDPMLAYRFLRYMNSAGLGLNRDITSLHHGLMVLGLSRLKAWLLEQLPHASTDLNLQPIRAMMVLRAQCMAELLEAGESEALKRELYLCGLLSQMDGLLGEPLASALHALALPERVTAALLDHRGPYWPYLEMAEALETPNTTHTRAVCATHGFEAAAVNLALLRTLAAWRPQPA